MLHVTARGHIARVAERGAVQGGAARQGQQAGLDPGAAEPQRELILAFPKRIGRIPGGVAAGVGEAAGAPVCAALVTAVWAPPRSASATSGAPATRRIRPGKDMSSGRHTNPANPFLSGDNWEPEVVGRPWASRGAPVWDRLWSRHRLRL